MKETSLKQKQIKKAIAGEYKNTPFSKLPTHIALNMIKNDGKYVEAKKTKEKMVYGGMAKKKMMAGGRMKYKDGGAMPKAKPC